MEDCLERVLEKLFFLGYLFVNFLESRVTKERERLIVRLSKQDWGSASEQEMTSI